MENSSTSLSIELLIDPMPTGDETAQDSEWLRNLPKAELHLHLEGTVTPETLVVLSKRHDSEPLTSEQARALYTYTDFLDFLRIFSIVSKKLVNAEDFGFITSEMIRALSGQGVVHAEVYISWGNLLHREKAPTIVDVMDAVEQARIRGQEEFGVSILWIVDFTRQYGVEEALATFRLAADLRHRYPSIVGIGIGGDEARGPSSLFKAAYAEAKAAGLRLTAHAGESTGPIDGPIEIRAALDIGVERIGHALAAQYDQDLMTTLKQTQVPLELNVTSNLKTQCCPSLKEHPLRKYFEAGLNVTINSDDPPMFGSNLLQEYILVKREFGFNLEQMRDFAAKSIEASFLPDEGQQRLLKRVHEYCG